MFKSVAIVSLLTSVAFAQSSTSANSTANPLIPSGISPSCTTYLTSLNSDSTLGSCLSSLTTATSAFAPGSKTPTSASVTSALTGLCADSVSNACPESLIRSKITAFYTACTAELTTNKVSDIIRMYDVLYTIPPLRTSICSKDDSGAWCVMAATTTTREVSDAVAGDSSSLSLSQLLALLYTDNSGALKRRADVTAILPNMTTYHDTNLPFLFFTPSLDATKLCTTCSRNVLTAYINFESNVPYGPGLAQSQLLDTQSALYSAIQEKCPAGFLSGAVQAAGGLSGGLFSSGAISTVGAEYQSILALAMGVATLAVSVAF
ncbi:hypothetical protein M413DRAFT_445073 [Hebeloma cylindrosporum]|uniref:DUF7729 domain-containing protein n=1 Tax=Hebeloma cylindrosporum TaxID=76867 RepID=A0A0C2XW23_HEBCY|nr:hypothetical protein M413DRAFT_445073 [Hebeloma cylindrosporum h7]